VWLSWGNVASAVMCPVFGAQDAAAVGTIGPPPDPSATCKSFYDLRRALRGNLSLLAFDLQLKFVQLLTATNSV
jgi:hypothetical protein